METNRKMKKLLLMLLVIVGGAVGANAQRQTTGTIRVAFTDPTNKWEQSKFLMYVFGTTTSKDDTWPGVDITANTTTINGQTYYYRDFSIETYGTGFKVIAVNQDSEGNNQSQSEDLTWCYDRTSITGDTYYSLKDEWDNSKRKAELKEMYYVADYDNSGKVLLTTQSGTNYSTSFTTTDFPKFVIANSFAFKDDGTLDYTQNKNYPENIYRPSYENTLTFQTLNKDVSDSQRTEFYRWHGAGFWNASSLTDVTLDMTFTMSSDNTFNPTNYTLSPYRTTTITDALYATWSNGEKYTVSGATAYTVSAKNTSSVTLTAMDADAVYSAGTGLILNGTSGATVTINAVASDAETTSIGTNYLVGSGNNSATPSTGDNIYVFSWDGENTSSVGFYKATTGTLEAHKAYLDLSGASAREFLGFSFGDESTGISEVGAKATDSAAYNLQGVRNGKLQKGINIVNGKKVMVK